LLRHLERRQDLWQDLDGSAGKLLLAKTSELRPLVIALAISMESIPTTIAVVRRILRLANHVLVKELIDIGHGSPNKAIDHFGIGSDAVYSQ
jgi:hypothetical protein